MDARLLTDTQPPKCRSSLSGWRVLLLLVGDAERRRVTTTPSTRLPAHRTVRRPATARSTLFVNGSIASGTMKVRIPTGILTRALSSNRSRPSSVARKVFESSRKGRPSPTISRDARASETQLVTSGIDDVSQLDVASTRAPAPRPRSPDSPTPALMIEFNSESVPEPLRTAIIWVSARPTPKSRTLAKLTTVQTRSRIPSRSSPSPRARNGNAIAAEATGASWAPVFHAVFRPMLS